MDAEPFEIREPLMLVSVARTYREGADVYEIARYAWKVDVARARRYDLVLAYAGGVVVGAFRPDEWLPATREHFPDKGDDPGRSGFTGRDAEAETWGYYVGSSVPDGLRGRSAFRYCDPE